MKLTQDSAEGWQTNTNKKGLSQSLKGYGNNGYSFFHAVITIRNKPLFPQVKKYPTTILRNPISRQVTKENHISARKPINHINPYHRRAKSMNKNAGKTMFHCFHRFWTITVTQTNISVVRHTPMRIRVYLPKKTINTSGLCWNRKASMEPGQGRTAIMEQSQRGIITN